jgi:hypothetical protein
MGADGTCGTTIADGITAPPSASEQDPELATDPEADLEIELELSLAALEDPVCVEEELPPSKLGSDQFLFAMFAKCSHVGPRWLQDHTVSNSNSNPNIHYPIHL